MKSKLLITVFAMTISNLVFAQPIGFGEPDCGQWVQSQTATSTLKQSNRAWLLGWVSGLNMNPLYNDALGKVNSAAQIYLWVDNYCKNNPLSGASVGGIMLLAELMKKP